MNAYIDPIDPDEGIDREGRFIDEALRVAVRDVIGIGYDPRDLAAWCSTMVVDAAALARLCDMVQLPRFDARRVTEADADTAAWSGLESSNAD